jgi:hypothetical protein
VSKATALASRYVAYAMKFLNESKAIPTDAELERVLSGCVRAPRPEEYPKIRAEVESWRRYGLTTAELAELEDATAVWAVTRGDLNRIAGRPLSDEEVGRAFDALAGGDVMDAVASVVTTVIPDGRYL